MQSSRLYRLGVFGLLTSGAIATAVACSDDNAAGPATVVDSGVDAQADTGGPQPPPPDAGADADAAPPPPAKPRLVVNLAHAISDLEVVQFCLGVGTTFPAPDPIPPTGGIPAGFGAGLPIPDAFVSVLNNLDLNIYVFPAGLATAGAKCGDIVAGNGGVPADKVFALNPVTKGTFQLDNSYLLLLSGCQAGNETGVAECGADYDGGSSLRVETLKLDPNSVGAGKTGFQFVHASPQAQAFFQVAFGETQIQARVLEQDGGATTNIGSPVGYTRPASVTPGTAVAASSTALVEPATSGIEFVASDGGAFPAPVFVDFNSIALMSTGGIDGGAAAYFAKDQNFALIAIGNPGAADPASAHGFRLIALRSSLLK